MNLRPLICAIALLSSGLLSDGATIVGPWVPKFKGVDYSVSTNTPGSGGVSIRRQVVHALRVDLADPDVRLFTTPRLLNYVEGSREIGGLTVSDFLRNHQLQAAVNANFFSERQYYLPAGFPMDVYGLAISEGIVVSPQDGPAHDATLMFNASNQPTVIYTNWPARSVEGVHTAVTGNYPLLISGTNVARATDVEPRTAFGLSADRRYLYLVAVDGRQSGYSDGSTDVETSSWLLRLGAHDAVNMDGGGSTTLVMQNSTGAPLRLNRSSAVEDSGRERTVGSHFGVYAKPLSGFINDVAATAEETTATITFTTAQPATAEIEYGVTDSFGTSTGLYHTPTTNHQVSLTGLIPGTDYFYRIIAFADEQRHSSDTFSFKTTKNTVFALTNAWRYTTGQTPPAVWTQSNFDDTSWNGPGPGLLWTDTRADGPNVLVEPKSTEMPFNPATEYPYISYYFRTSFSLDEMKAGSSLQFSALIDDGAVFYLNGTEIHRLRMPETFDSQTLASDFPCAGDATCFDEFTISSESLAGIVSTNNVLAVEVHNYNARSADITFGLDLSRIDPIVPSMEIKIKLVGESVHLEWDGSGSLQSAPAPDGPWLDIQEKPSPVTIAPSEERRFYRIRN